MGTIMIHIIIGQSGCGKTTFAKKKFAGDNPPIPQEGGPVPWTLYGEVAFIGKYGIGIRTEGTDTLSYNALPKILKLIDELYPKRDIVVEGDRINNGKFFKHIIAKGYNAKVYLLRCSLETSLKRLRAGGSKITPAWVRSTSTKSYNNFRIYGPLLSDQYMASTEG